MGTENDNPQPTETQTWYWAKLMHFVDIPECWEIVAVDTDDDGELVALRAGDEENHLLEEFEWGQRVYWPGRHQESQSPDTIEARMMQYTREWSRCSGERFTLVIDFAYDHDRVTFAGVTDPDGEVSWTEAYTSWGIKDGKIVEIIDEDEVMILYKGDE